MQLNKIQILLWRFFNLIYSIGNRILLDEFKWLTIILLLGFDKSTHNRAFWFFLFFGLWLMQLTLKEILTGWTFFDIFYQHEQVWEWIISNDIRGKLITILRIKNKLSFFYWFLLAISTSYKLIGKLNYRLQKYALLQRLLQRLCWILMLRPLSFMCTLWYILIRTPYLDMQKSKWIDVIWHVSVSFLYRVILTSKIIDGVCYLFKVNEMGWLEEFISFYILIIIITCILYDIIKPFLVYLVEAGLKHDIYYQDLTLSIEFIPDINLPAILHKRQSCMIIEPMIFFISIRKHRHCVVASSRLELNQFFGSIDFNMYLGLFIFDSDEGVIFPRFKRHTLYIKYILHMAMFAQLSSRCLNAAEIITSYKLPLEFYKSFSSYFFEYYINYYLCILQCIEESKNDKELINDLLILKSRLEPIIKEGLFIIWDMERSLGSDMNFIVILYKRDTNTCLGIGNIFLDYLKNSSKKNKQIITEETSSWDFIDDEEKYIQLFMKFDEIDIFNELTVVNRELLRQSWKSSEETITVFAKNINTWRGEWEEEWVGQRRTLKWK